MQSDFRKRITRELHPVLGTRCRLIGRESSIIMTMPARCRELDRVCGVQPPHPATPAPDFADGTRSASALDVDLLIVGGGINGAGIARDAAGRGLRVCLLEQSDLASFTSSASTKLIHGGLRYLEHGEFRLVREALAERERLLRIAPHLVHPLRFVLPHAPGLRARWQIRLGLLLYDRLGGRRRLPASRAIDLRGDVAGAPLVPTCVKGFEYSDCRVDDSRLVVLNAMDAAARGAVILTRTRMVRARSAREGWHVDCASGEDGHPVEVRAKAVVNAGGAWVNEIRRALGLTAPERIRLVKGSHIVVPRLFAGDHAYILQNPDRRIVFAIPFEGRFTLIGTTDVPYEGGLDAATISADEVAYLCESVNRYFKCALAPAQAVWSYAGVRTLRDDAAPEASAVTREYELALERSAGGAPALSVIGGKITTYRTLAEGALAKLQPLIGGGSRRWTHAAPLPGGDLPGDSFRRFLEEALQRWRHLPPELVGRLARSYGTRMELILEGADSIDALGERFGADLTAAEAEYLRRHEWAVRAEDVLWRRSKLGLAVTAGDAQRLEVFMRGAAGRPASPR
jgi:glycerol-3-phosphate dehydrogenase